MKATEALFVLLVISLIVVACKSSTTPSTETLYPTALASVEGGEHQTYEDIEFDASESMDNDDIGQGIVEYSWDFYGDGTYDLATPDPTVVFQYSIFGTHNVQLRVRDNENEIDTLDEPLEVGVLGSEIHFADAELESGIRELLDIQSGPIYIYDTSGLNEISFDNLTISSLSGIEDLIDLRLLGFDNCTLNDISAFYLMTDLTSLSMDDCILQDPDPVGGLTSLANLRMHGCSLTDISWLSGLHELVAVDLSFNNITDITILINAWYLNYLDLSGNPLDNILSLSDCHYLDQLNISNCGISDIAPLEDISGIFYIDISNNSITDLQPLVDNTHFEDTDILDVRGNPLSPEAVTIQVPELINRGVTVYYDQ